MESLHGLDPFERKKSILLATFIIATNLVASPSMFYSFNQDQASSNETLRTMGAIDRKVYGVL